MKIVKIILGLLVTLAIVVAIVVFFGLSKINGIVEKAIETVGTETLQTSVNVSSVDIKLVEGKGQINGITIANPKGYSSNNLLSVGDIGLQIDIESLPGNVKVIKEIYVDAVQLRAEQKNITDTNIQALIDNMKRSSSGSSSNSDNSQSSGSGPDVRLMIEKLRFGESSLTLETEKYGGKTLKIPGYTQTNIGNKTKGLAPDEIGPIIVSSILNKAQKAVKRELREAAKDKAEEKLKDKLKEKLGDKISSDDVDKLKGLFK